jgi:hypothetical protein
MGPLKKVFFLVESSLWGCLTWPLMIRSLLLIFSPMTAWQKIADQSWHFLVVFLFSVAPLLLASCALEGWAMLKFGVGKGIFGDTIIMDQDKIISFQILQLILNLGLMFLGALFIKWICQGFQTEATYQQAFTLTAYGLTPVFWLRFLDSAPAIPTWLCWGIAALGIMTILYHGIALMLQPSTSIGFGLYLVSSFSLVAFSGIAHFVATGILTERFELPSLVRVLGAWIP